jgi:oxygen-independent coproporphyrinogen-3 oxidase
MAAPNPVKDSSSEAAPPRWWWPRAAYLHVPFCAHHCGYCDFAVVAGQDHLADRYLDALAQEIATLPGPQPVETVFIGGGTPTHLNSEQLARLLHTVRNHFQLSADYEFTVEANPGTLDAAKIDVLTEHGVNRLSLGAQSFQPHLLQVLERNHVPRDVASAVAYARQRIPNISLDLIFATPGQTLEQWHSDLEQALGLSIDHLSTYGLTYEKGTRLWKQRERGEVRPIGEELERAMYACAMDTLEPAGFEHYEISNFARPGRRCRHNQVYWANEAYFAFGLGAARYVHGRREVNTRNLPRYLQQVSSGQSPVQQSEELSPQERARETAALQMRRCDGIKRRAFHEQTGYDLDILAPAALHRHRSGGLLADDGERVYLTREGKFLADVVCRDFLVPG